MTSAPKITIQHLIKCGLIHPATAEKHRHRWDRLNDILGGTPGTEPDSTTLITMSDGPLEKAMVDAMCDAAGIPVEDREGIRLLSGGEFRTDSGVKDRRTIDIVGARRVHDSAVRNAWHPLFATEAKYGAWVNGGHGYCKANPGMYSNQVICYLHECIDARLNDEVKFIWLGNAVTDPEMAPWGRKGIVESDFPWPGLEDAHKQQELARKRWNALTWLALGAAITAALTAEGFAAEAEAIVRFLRAGGPSAN
jgi:hypothetical protein